MFPRILYWYLKNSTRNESITYLCQSWTIYQGIRPKVHTSGNLTSFLAPSFRQSKLESDKPDSNFWDPGLSLYVIIQKRLASSSFFDIYKYFPGFVLSYLTSNDMPFCMFEINLSRRTIFRHCVLNWSLTAFFVTIVVTYFVLKRKWWIAKRRRFKVGD